MNRIKNSLIALAGTLALIGVIAALTSSPTRGQGGGTPSKDVSVVNTPAVNVVNTPAVSARQEGSWSVALAEGASVGIDPARNKVKLDESAREPVTINLQSLVETSPNFYSTDKFPIPEGKRLVVEHIYGSANRNEATTFLPKFELRSWFGDSPVSILELSYTQQPRLDNGGIGRFLFTQPVTFCVSNPADDGLAWKVSVTSFYHGWPGPEVIISGYLEPLP